MRAYPWYVLAALTEIAGCFAFWSWLRNGKSVLCSIPGVLSLALFAIALTRVDTDHAGRAYAAYGGVYILLSVMWLWSVEKVRPDRWDLVGTAVCMLGSLIILYGPRAK